MKEKKMKVKIYKKHTYPRRKISASLSPCQWLIPESIKCHKTKYTNELTEKNTIWLKIKILYPKFNYVK